MKMYVKLVADNVYRQQRRQEGGIKIGKIKIAISSGAVKKC